MGGLGNTGGGGLAGRGGLLPDELPGDHMEGVLEEVSIGCFSSV